MCGAPVAVGDDLFRLKSKQQRPFWTSPQQQR
jgi:hypothetical protein